MAKIEFVNGATTVDKIVAMVQSYRELRAHAKVIKDEMDLVKDTLEPLIWKHGKWTDDEGYAQIVSRGPSVRFSGKDVEALRIAWLKSDDPVMKSCGEVLAASRSERDGYEYLRVK